VCCGVIRITIGGKSVGQYPNSVASVDGSTAFPRISMTVNLDGYDFGHGLESLRVTMATAEVERPRVSVRYLRYWFI